MTAHAAGAKGDGEKRQRAGAVQDVGAPATGPAVSEVVWNDLSEIEKAVAVSRHVMHEEFGTDLAEIAVAICRSQVKRFLSDWNDAAKLIEKLTEGGFIVSLINVSEDAEEDWEVLHIGNSWRWTAIVQAGPAFVTIGPNPLECLAVSALRANGIEVRL